jgi:hypothetical protein
MTPYEYREQKLAARWSAVGWAIAAALFVILVSYIAAQA